MKTLKIFVLMLISISIFSCSKDKNEDLSFTPLAGEWIDLKDDKVAEFNTTALGTRVKIHDQIINSTSVAEDSLFLYIRLSSSQLKPGYYHVPCQINGLGSVEFVQTADYGYRLLLMNHQGFSTNINYHIRGLVIPKNKIKLVKIDLTDYDLVKELWDFLEPK